MEFEGVVRRPNVTFKNIGYPSTKPSLYFTIRCPQILTIPIIRLVSGDISPSAILFEVGYLS